MPVRSFWATSGLLLAAAISPLAAQGTPDAKDASTAQTMDGKLVDRLPVDRVRQALLLLPGIVAAGERGVSVRGGRGSDAATYLDGVPLTAGVRKSGLIFDRSGVPAPGQSFLEIGTNSLTGLEAMTGPLDPSLGRGQAGVILLETLTPDKNFDASAAIESDRPFGSLHGRGIDRLQGMAAGRLANRLRVSATAVIDGRESVESGPGAPDDPIFVPAGVDTTVAVPSAINNPFADTTFVDVFTFAVARGHCDAFSASTNPGIAGNYGQDCLGARIPATGSSSYQIHGRLVYDVAPGSSLWLSGAASRDQFRYFEPSVISVPPPGNKASSRVLSLGARHGLTIAGRRLAVSAAISFQKDQTIGGPLSPESEQDTRDGVFLSPLEFMWDFKSFPVNEELITNIRDNIAGSRRSPLDLENTSQYGLINRYRNSPYGLDGGPEAGGPSGRLQMLEEKRTVGMGSVEWQLRSDHILRAGFELTRYDILGYSHQLNSQAFADAFLAEPVQSAFYVESRIRAGSFSLVAGWRYDRFRSGAERPFLLDTIASSPTFGEYHSFPSPNSYGSGGTTFNGQPLVRFIADEAKSAWSPRFKVAFAAGANTVVRAGVALQRQMPDLGLVLSGVNTDIRVSSSNHLYGGDLDLERTTLLELGIRQRLTSMLNLDAALYHRALGDQAVPSIVTQPDPGRLGEEISFFGITSLGLGQVTGIDARLDARVGLLSAMIGYAYQDASFEFDDPFQPATGSIPMADSRPHTLTAAWAAEVPGSWGRGTAATILRNSSLYGTFRYSSGTPYTRCPAETGNESVLSGQSCNRTFEGEPFGSRLPSYKSLDFRITRGFAIAGGELVAYLDARNVLGFENVLRVYTVTGTTSNPSEAREVLSTDSAGFADLGIANGIRGANGELDFTFGGAVASGCGNFVNSQFTPAAPDCVYLIRAEERFGNGDHIFTLAEQREASMAAYRVVRGRPTFLGAPRRLRLGLEVRF